MRTASYILASTFAAVGAGSAPAPADLPLQRVLPMEVARDLATAAAAKCTSQGFPVTVTVLDRGGQPLVMLRDAGAPPHTVDSSRRKAFTALTLRRPSHEFAEALKTMEGARPLAELDGMIALGGGTPLKSGGEIVGAIGVGGAPGGDKDMLCVQAGLDAIAARLN
jgi:uncharacterized protein GlcG (DUF336 family)